MTLRDLAEQIKQRLQLLDINASDKQIANFEAYLLLLEKWNKTYNLTAVRGLKDMLDRHLLDSLSIAKHLQGKSFFRCGYWCGFTWNPFSDFIP